MYILKEENKIMKNGIILEVCETCFEPAQLVQCEGAAKSYNYTTESIIFEKYDGTACHESDLIEPVCIYCDDLILDYSNYHNYDGEFICENQECKIEEEKNILSNFFNEVK